MPCVVPKRSTTTSSPNETRPSHEQPAMSDNGIEIRRAVADDRPAILELLAAALGWVPDAQHASFFEWKHDTNSFGVSPAWVATDSTNNGDLAGVRIFLRWEFVDRDQQTRKAVRAVDTATHPKQQGKGIFRRLTMQALDELLAEGTDFVFNTPNSQSRP